MAQTRIQTANPISHKAASEKGARRISEIISAGSEILLADGIRAVNKRRIAKMIGISDGNVGYYFPTRESLWSAVVRHEVDRYYARHHPPFAAETSNAEAQWDEYILRWIGEYDDPLVRVFFSQIISGAEMNSTVAELRDEIYERFLQETIQLARPLVPEIDERELEDRSLTVIAMLEGLHAVSAFRPRAIKRNPEFRARVLAEINGMIRGE